MESVVNAEQGSHVKAIDVSGDAFVKTEWELKLAVWISARNVSDVIQASPVKQREAATLETNAVVKTYAGVDEEQQQVAQLNRRLNVTPTMPTSALVASVAILSNQAKTAMSAGYGTAPAPMEHEQTEVLLEAALVTNGSFVNHVIKTTN